jgi:hypothetical protein
MISKEVILMIVAIAAGIVIAIATYPNDGRVIDCGIAEISPDYTNAMKEACRKARSDNDYRPK